MLWNYIPNVRFDCGRVLKRGSTMGSKRGSSFIYHGYSQRRTKVLLTEDGSNIQYLPCVVGADITRHSGSGAKFFSGFLKPHASIQAAHTAALNMMAPASVAPGKEMPLL